jgi:hypothetical protein
MSGRVHEDHVVDGHTSTEDTAGVSSGVRAKVLIPKVEVTDISRETGQVNGSQVLAPHEGFVRTGCDSRADASLEEENLVTGLDELFGGDDTSGATTNDDVVIVSILEAGCRDKTTEGSN